jgi:hypothetical protein
MTNQFFRASTALKMTIECWDDWSDEGLFQLSKLFRAYLLLWCYERKQYDKTWAPWSDKYSDEFMTWATNWLG